MLYCLNFLLSLAKCLVDRVDRIVDREVTPVEEVNVCIGVGNGSNQVGNANFLQLGVGPLRHLLIFKHRWPLSTVGNNAGLTGVVSSVNALTRFLLIVLMWNRGGVLLLQGLLGVLLGQLHEVPVRGKNDFLVAVVLFAHIVEVEACLITEMSVLAV